MLFNIVYTIYTFNIYVEIQYLYIEYVCVCTETYGYIYLRKTFVENYVIIQFVEGFHVKRVIK